MQIDDSASNSGHIQSEELNSFFELSEDLMGIADLQGNITRTNKKFQEALGYSENELVGISFVSLIHPEDMPSANQEIQKLLAGAKTVGFTNRYKKKDGTYIWLQWDSSASANSLFGVARDITSEMDQKNKELYYQLILDYANDAIISKNLDGIVTYWNNSAEKLYGYTKKEMIGSSIELIIPKDKLKDLEMIMNKIKQGEIVDHYETVRLTKDGKLVNILLSVTPIKDIQGTVTGASIIAQGITSRKIEQQKLLDSYDEISKMNDLMTGRELKMIELKDEVEQLKKQLLSYKK